MRRRGRKASWLFDRREEIGADEEDWSSVFDVVVRMRRLWIEGRRLVSWLVKSEMGVEASVGRDRVGGTPRPENELRRMLMVREAMIAG